jgi:hypothetical protein
MIERQAESKEISIMNTIPSSTDSGRQYSQMKSRNPQIMRTIRILSWMVTLIFLIALAWAIYQAVVESNPLPVWVWLGLVVLLSAAVGLAVMVVVYRGVVRQAGPFDFRPSDHVAGSLRSEVQRVEAGGASSLRAEIKMLAGVLHLAGGSAVVMDSGFTYDDADWKPPQVAYGVDAAGQGKLLVEQQSTNRPAMRQGRCEWDIRLSGEIPTELYVKFGAGKADLRLGGLALTHLQVESGVGEMVMDLSGEWGRSMEAFIQTGIGDTVLRLPQDAGVRVQTAVGFGSTHSHSLTWDGEAYVNALYGQTQVDLEITIQGGMGKLTLEQVG